jgi:hypothetical protein
MPSLVNTVKSEALGVRYPLAWGYEFKLGLVRVDMFGEQEEMSGQQRAGCHADAHVDTLMCSANMRRLDRHLS